LGIRSQKNWAKLLIILAIAIVIAKKTDRLGSFVPGAESSLTDVKPDRYFDYDCGYEYACKTNDEIRKGHWHEGRIIIG
jgi:hypothetical protein